MNSTISRVQYFIEKTSKHIYVNIYSRDKKLHVLFPEGLYFCDSICEVYSADEETAVSPSSVKLEEPLLVSLDSNVRLNDLGYGRLHYVTNSSSSTIVYLEHLSNVFMITQQTSKFNFNKTMESLKFELMGKTFCVKNTNCSLWFWKKFREGMIKFPIDSNLSKKGIECSVCLDNLKLQDRATQLSCSHIYHENCFALWSEKRNSCPTCRAIFNDEDSDDSDSDSDDSD